MRCVGIWYQLSYLQTNWHQMGDVVNITWTAFTPQDISWHPFQVGSPRCRCYQKKIPTFKSIQTYNFHAGWQASIHCANTILQPISWSYQIASFVSSTSLIYYIFFSMNNLIPSSVISFFFCPLFKTKRPVVSKYPALNRLSLL